MTIVFMGTPDFAVPCLQALVEDSHDIAAVYTQPDQPAGRGRKPRSSPVKVAAQALGLPLLQPPSLRQPAAVEELAALKPEVIIVCAFGQLLRQNVLDIPPKGVLNIHPSLLPRHRGASPIPASILSGDALTGVTVMLMDAGMDTGPILSQRSLPITPFDSTGTLTQKLSLLAAELTVETLPRWLRGQIQPQPQDHSQATVAPLIKKEHGALDWSLSAHDLWLRVRAYNPWPGAHTSLDSELLHIWEAWPLPGNSGQPLGTVVPLSGQQLAQLPSTENKGAFAVQTERELLAVLNLQRAGRRPLSAADFLRGMPDFMGRRLLSPKGNR